MENQAETDAWQGVLGRFGKQAVIPNPCSDFPPPPSG